MNWKIIGASILSILTFSIDGSIVNIALPSIAADFGIGTSEASFVPTSYFISVSSTIMFFSAAFGRFGIKRVIIAGNAVFFISTVLCAFSNGIWQLVAFRLLQGIGGSVMVIGPYTIIPKFIKPEKTGLALGLLSASSAVGIALGYPAGGALTLHFGWRSIFYFLIPLSAAVAVISFKAIPDDSHEAVRRKIDLPGAVAFFGALALLTFAMSMNEEFGTASPVILAAFFCAAVLIAIFVVIEKKTSVPLISPGLFSSPAYSLNMASRLFAAIMQNGNLFILPFFLKYTLGLAPDIAGLVIASYSVIYIIMAPVSGMLADRFSPEKVSMISLGIIIAASTSFVFLIERAGVPHVIAFLGILSMGFALFYPANNKRTIMLAGTDLRGMSVGVFITVWICGMSMGVSVFELVFSNSLSVSSGTVNALAGKLASASPDGLMAAFRNSYIAGAGSIWITLILYLLSGGAKSRRL